MVYSRRPFFVSDLVLAQPMKSPMIVKKQQSQGRFSVVLALLVLFSFC